MKKKELKRQMDKLMEINNLIVAENYILNASVDRTEKHILLCESANSRFKTIIGYLEEKIIEMVAK